MSRPVLVLQKRKRQRLWRCGRKVGYPTSANARDDLERPIGRQGEDDRLGSYHCGTCKGFHNRREPRGRSST